MRSSMAERQAYTLVVPGSNPGASIIYFLKSIDLPSILDIDKFNW